MSWPVLCPRCRVGLVPVRTSSWASSRGPRRCLWLEEPARCSAGCGLTWLDVQRLLLRAYRAPARQLPLFEEAAG